MKILLACVVVFSLGVNAELVDDKVIETQEKAEVEQAKADRYLHLGLLEKKTKRSVAKAHSDLQLVEEMILHTGNLLPDADGDLCQIDLLNLKRDLDAANLEVDSIATPSEFNQDTIVTWNLAKEAAWNYAIALAMSVSYECNDRIELLLDIEDDGQTIESLEQHLSEVATLPFVDLSKLNESANQVDKAWQLWNNADSSYIQELEKSIEKLNAVVSEANKALIEEQKRKKTQRQRLRTSAETGFVFLIFFAICYRAMR